ncbi:MAG TPA: alpha/beta hydrolase [Blastocatellia bacterium]|jgi:acetyl esterase/lipase|nr:alpha/beta hydrolase [Blastocatellia bacterium]
MSHWKSFAALLLIATFTSIGMAQEGGKLEDPPWIKEVAPQRIVYVLPGMQQIKARKDITYKRVAGVELKMDVYNPQKLPRGARRPAVVFIHGGAIPPNLRTKPKEWGSYVSYGQLAAASGFVGITFNHRFHGWDMKAMSDARSDVADAIAYIRSNAESLGVDGDRICLWALSGGSLLVGPAIADAPPYIRSLVFYYAVMDLEALRKERPVITDEAASEFSLISRLKGAVRAFAPIYIARAGRDEPGLNIAVDRFIQEAMSRKATLDFSNHAEGQHGFDVLNDDERTREIIRRTLEFIKAHS